MPAKSKEQFRLMKGICEGSIPPGGNNPTVAEACEYVKGQSPKGLRKAANDRSGRR